MEKSNFLTSFSWNKHFFTMTIHVYSRKTVNLIYLLFITIHKYSVNEDLNLLHHCACSTKEIFLQNICKIGKSKHVSCVDIVDSEACKTDSITYMQKG